MSTALRYWLLILAGFYLAACSSSDQDTIARLNTLDLTQYEIVETRMFLAGEFNTRTPAKIKSALTSNPQVRTLVLTDMPGSLDDENLYPFASWIRSQGYNTHLKKSSVIASGAVDLFLAGVERTMEKGARLGVHSWSDGKKEATDYPREHSEHDQYVDYTVSMLGSDAFYWFTINAATADGMHWMSDEEITRFGILTQPIIQP